MVTQGCFVCCPGQPGVNFILSVAVMISISEEEKKEREERKGLLASDFILGDRNNVITHPHINKHTHK